MRISLVVPCYQEEDALGAFGPALEGLDAFEVLFVDDGSTDGTAGRLTVFAAADARVRIRTHATNRGVGAAMRTGLEAARGDVVVVYDADRTYAPETIPRLVAAVVDGADVATASPWADGGGATGVARGRVWLSRAGSWAYARVLGRRGRGVRTFTCAFRAYRRSWIPRLGFCSDGFGAAAEILGLALLEGARVVEVPARLVPRREGRSKMRVLPAAKEHLGVLARLLRRRFGSAHGRGRRMTRG